MSDRCEDCLNFEYDDEYNEYVCTVDMDMDDLVRIMSDKRSVCPFFRINNEYKIVEKQN